MAVASPFSVTRRPTPLSRPVGGSRPRRSSPATVQVGHIEHVLTVPPAIVRGFANAVADSLVAGVLPYADRDRLLRRAVRLGIGRFDANLIIASVQHRSGDASPRRSDLEIRRDRPAGLLSILFVILGTQLVIVALAVGWMLV